MSQVLSTDHDLLAFRGVLARRLCAFAVDLLLMSLFGWMLAASIVVFGILTLGLGFLLFHIMPFAPFLYFTLFIATGGTPGQRVFGLAVRQDAGLASPTPAQALVWSLLLGLSFFVFAGLPFLMALVGPRRRAGHDILSGLVVIRAPQIFY